MNQNKVKGWKKRQISESMEKEQMVLMLKNIGCDENTVSAMSNAYDLGVEWAKQNLIALPVVTLPLEIK